MTLSPSLYPQLTTLCTSDALCPAQILVIDRVNGPADVLVDTLSLLAGRAISVTLVTDQADALRLLDYFPFDAVVVGVEAHQPVQLAVLRPIQTLHPELPVLVVGHELPPSYKQVVRQTGAAEALDLPSRAAELKRVIDRLVAELLPQVQTPLLCDCA